MPGLVRPIGQLCSPRPRNVRFSLGFTAPPRPHLPRACSPSFLPSTLVWWWSGRTLSRDAAPSPTRPRRRPPAPGRAAILAVRLCAPTSERKRGDQIGRSIDRWGTRAPTRLRPMCRRWGRWCGCAAPTARGGRAGSSRRSRSRTAAPRRRARPRPPSCSSAAATGPSSCTPSPLPPTLPLFLAPAD
jgi:hypothetical protein